MQPDFEAMADSLSMTEIIRLQNLLSAALVRRFEQYLALTFSDIVGSTTYFARFGNEAGRQLQQRHYDLLNQAIGRLDGRIIDTAGDGAFLCFPSVDHAASAAIELLRLISADNEARTREHQLAVRVGIHYGRVLTDGVQVTGDSANLCARITATANPGEIRLTKAAFLAFSDVQYRLQCRMLPPAVLKGIEAAVDLAALEWRDPGLYPTSVWLETGKEYALPDQDLITFGRLKEKDGRPANDIVLECADPKQTLRISRWHFELRRGPEGFLLRAVTSAPLTVNGKTLGKGEEAPIHPGDAVCVGDVLGLEFRAAPRQDACGETILPTAFDHPIRGGAARGQDSDRSGQAPVRITPDLPRGRRGSSRS